MNGSKFCLFIFVLCAILTINSLLELEIPSTVNVTSAISAGILKMRIRYLAF